MRGAALSPISPFPLSPITAALSMTHRTARAQEILDRLSPHQGLAGPSPDDAQGLYSRPGEGRVGESAPAPGTGPGPAPGQFRIDHRLDCYPIRWLTVIAVLGDSSLILTHWMGPTQLSEMELHWTSTDGLTRHTREVVDVSASAPGGSRGGDR